MKGDAQQIVYSKPTCDANIVLLEMNLLEPCLFKNFGVPALTRAIISGLTLMMSKVRAEVSKFLYKNACSKFVFVIKLLAL